MKPNPVSSVDRCPVELTAPVPEAVPEAVSKVGWAATLMLALLAANFMSQTFVSSSNPNMLRSGRLC